MNTIGYIFVCLLIFIVVLSFLRLVTIMNVKKKTEEISVPLKYIKKKYNLKFRERKSKQVRLYIDIVNAIAIVIPVYLLLFIDLKINKVLLYLIMLIVFIVLVISGYNLIGIIMKRKDDK